MTIEVNGKPVEAYHLIMKKENALDILKGKKKVEIRAFSKKYNDMFINKELYKEFQEYLKDPDGSMELEDCLNETEYIYFTNYNKSWYLIVEVLDIAVYKMTQEDVEVLNEDYDFHDFDNEWQQYKDLPEDEIPVFYGLGLADVISHEGLI
uniref:Uncharacterized protein n=1 Tax=Siphoviridae sp. ctGkF12 TaxID=2826224 RepID=A0A8S5M971_9CAUD|nr:MAG TPA: hypothetical protein [Siphoviridae sp. ctGkF12]